MATDFYSRQDTARTSTTWLVVMFLLAVVGMVGSIFAISYVGIEIYNAQAKDSGHIVNRTIDSDLSSDLAYLPAVISLLLIIFGTLYKVSVLRRGGGTTVAEGLGGKRLFPDTQDPTQRQLLNIVEEMAIASGIPVPPVFFLENEDSINAFAAGYSPSDAVLGVTRGCAEKLTRDELQGVIAHEFSHVLNGDMRISIRLIGILHGILLIGLLGQIIFRACAYGGSRRNSKSESNGINGIVVACIVAGLALIVIGFIGTIFGNLIKAAISRQREFLADASAVQFTRNPQGIAGALKRIGAVVRGSHLQAPGAAEASHMYFSKGLKGGLFNLSSTHPPLETRIRAIDPQWDGTFPETDTVVLQSWDERMDRNTGASGFSADGAQGFAGDTSTTSPPSAIEVVDQVEVPTEVHQAYAASLMSEIPKHVLSAAREPYGARAVTYCLLLDREDEIVRQHQLQILTDKAEADVARLTQKLIPYVDQLDVRTRLPLIDVALPALRSMSPSQYQTFNDCFEKLAQADNQLNLFEWMLSEVLLTHLRPQFETIRPPRIRYYKLKPMTDPCSILLSTVAHVGQSAAKAADAFAVAAKTLPELKQLRFQSRDESGLTPLRQALTTLATVHPKQLTRLMDACEAAICFDGHIKPQEVELLRGISDLLHCPIPPLLPGEDISERP
jgi:Zn-dependent protease with chaperone function